MLDLILAEVTQNAHNLPTNLSRLPDWFQLMGLGVVVMIVSTLVKVVTDKYISRLVMLLGALALTTAYVTNVWPSLT